MASPKRPRRRSMAEVDAKLKAQIDAITPASTEKFSESVAAVEGNEPIEEVYSISPERQGR